jgi:hypothetical protein
MCEEESVRYLRDLCNEKEALEKDPDPQHAQIAARLVAQGIENTVQYLYICKAVFFGWSRSEKNMLV